MSTLARLAPLVGADDAAALHLVDNPRGARIPELQPALQQRHGRKARVHHGFHGVGEHGVVLLVAALAALAGRLGLAGVALDLLHDALVVIARRELLDGLDHAPDFPVADETALHAQRLCTADGQIEHIAAAAQFSVPGHIQIMRESTWLATAKATREGMFALMMPVMTSTDGRWVAMTR